MTVLPACKRSYWGYLTAVLFGFFLCASLGKVWKGYDVEIENKIDVNRLYSTLARTIKRPEYHLPNLDPTKPKIVIILAYMHTGSTYTAELIRRHPGSFYEFEPLRAIQSSTLRGKPLILLNGTHREYDSRWKNITVTDPDVAAWLVHNVVTCNHRQLDVGTLSNFFFGITNKMYRDYVPYINCVAEGRSVIRKFHAKLLPQSPRVTTNVNKCVHMMEETCGNATIRLSKYIRLRVDALLKVVQKLDNVRVIHLVRDPRAMMDSQLRRKEYHVDTDFSNFVKSTRDMCLQMKNDLYLIDTMKDKLSNVFRTFRYEDLADYPMATAEELFKFIEVDFDTVFKIFVTNKSMKPDKNSKVRQAMWRSRIPLQHLKTVDKYCSSLYEQLGYIPFNSIEKVRNLNNKDHIDLQ